MHRADEDAVLDYGSTSDTDDGVVVVSVVKETVCGRDAAGWAAREDRPDLAGDAAVLDCS